MKRTLFIIALLICSFLSEARHITGGEMIYNYIGPGSTAGTSRYLITLLLFRDEFCANCAPMPSDVTIGVFNNSTGALVGSRHTVALGGTDFLSVNALPPCITNPPVLSYTVGSYSFAVELQDNSAGYTASYQTCCRIDDIRNIPDGTGATYVTRIPGHSNWPAGFSDNSPRFARGISVVCYKKPFTLDFSATDPDGDSLVYSFCEAYNGGAATNAAYNTPAGPPFGSVNYINGFSGATPLGNQATIDPATGIISGIAPDVGKYVVSVCVNSYRNGLYVSTHRKDFIISVAPCDFAGAQLLPSYISCDGFNFDFENLNNSPLNLTYYWDFGDGNTSTDPTPSHTYLVAGVYTLKLVVNRNGPCSDSATSELRVFPGYFPGFTENSPICKDRPLQFNDVTTANYGAANEWHWNFGDLTTAADTSNIKNPAYTYSIPGNYNVTLIVASDKGCRDTVIKVVTIVDKPAFTVTNDTLICSIDTLQLNATASTPGTITWSPNYNINNVNSFNPLVSPDVTTTYNVTLSSTVGSEAWNSRDLKSRPH